MRAKFCSFDDLKPAVTVVTMGIRMTQLNDVDEINQFITTSGWIKQVNFASILIQDNGPIMSKHYYFMYKCKLDKNKVINLRYSNVSV